MKEIEEIICYNAKPLFVGQELKGYFMDKESFLKLLALLNDGKEDCE